MPNPEAAMPRPVDFFISALDFFAVFLPGAALVYIVQSWALPYIPLSLRPSDTPQSWAAFLVLAYVAGHLLHAVATLLDEPVYDNWYLPKYQKEHFRVAKLTGKGATLGGDDASETLLARAYGYSGAVKGTSLYKWCLSFIKIYNTPAASEIDRYQADSKFFRSFAILAVLSSSVAFEFTGWPARLVVFTLALVAGGFSVWRYCDLRWSATKRLYEYYLLLNLYPDARRPTTPAPSAT
jgi:hypothetical protein